MVEAENNLRLHRCYLIDVKAMVSKAQYFSSRELHDAASARLAGVPLEQLQQLRGKAGEGVGSKSKGDSSSSGSSEHITSSRAAAVCPPSLGDFTAAEYDRLSRQIPEKRLDARDKSHYRAFDEVCWPPLHAARELSVC
jgi:hypothetical protein